MGPQNLNNYYFNRLDAHIDYSSYYDFFLASDEKDYNSEVIYSKYPIGVYGNESKAKEGIVFPSSTLGAWLDLNTTGTTKYFNIKCGNYYSDNTLLSLSYWDESRPNWRDAECSCDRCETLDYNKYPTFVTSICDIGLTGIDNGLTKYMKGNPNKCDFCKVSFTANTTFRGTITGITLENTVNFWPVTWSSNITNPPSCATGCEYPNTTINGIHTVSYTAKTTNNNLSGFDCDDMEYVTCCFLTGGTAYKFTLTNASVTHAASPPFGDIFTASTVVEQGYWKVPCGLDTLKLWEETPIKYKFDPLHYDRRFKMHAVTGYTKNPYDYNIISATDSCAGHYEQLDGGFYQGFFKLDGYPYEVLPHRTECGWTVDCLLKVRQNPDICPGHENTLNAKYPNNAGFFWYMGTRAENKFWNVFSAETNLRTCEQALYSCTGETTSIQQSACTETEHKCKKYISCVTATTYDNKIDSMSNAFGLRLTPDYKLGYRAIYYTGTCIMTGTCITGLTYNSGYTIVEEYTTNAICALTGSTQIGKEPWLDITARFERDYCFYGCDLLNMGGVNDLVYTKVPDPLASITGPTKRDYEIEFHKRWMDDVNYRKGTLTLFVNARPVLVVPNFEEIIPRRLNTKPQLQVGVPYNMSWGGGSQGLIESLTFTSGSTCYPYQKDNKDLGLLIEKNFAGTFDGGISQMKYYMEPLTADEIIHNYLVAKDRYNLIDCECNFTNCRPGRVIYLTEGDSVDLDITFGVSATTVSVDRLGYYIDPPKWTGVRFTNVIIDDFEGNILGYKIYIIDDMGKGTKKSVTLPFCAGPNDVIKIVIDKKDIALIAKMIIYGNLYK